MILGLHTANPSSTAILYFTRSAEVEARRKSLMHNDFKRNQQVIKALIDHTENVISKSGLTYYLSDSDSTSLSFGEQLTHNIDHVFAQGYTNIIILGNDCPTLTQNDIASAANILGAGHDTFGRAADGGLYLIGLQLESYHRALFQKLSWSRDSLAEDLDQYLATYSREIHCVSPTVKSDIDNHSDLMEFIDSNAVHLDIYHTIRSIVFVSYRSLDPFCNTYHSFLSESTTTLRGPPQIAA